MLIRRWDAAIDPNEWRAWLGTTAPFGELVVNNLDPDEPPIVVPTHAAIEGDALLIHLAKDNPAWPHLERARRVRFSILGDDAFVPGSWRASANVPREHGVPTSYYVAVQLTCEPTLVDEPEAKAELLRAQMRHLQPDGDHAPIEVGAAPYGPMLGGIRGLRLAIVEEVAKFKYDDHKPVELREAVSAALEERGRPHDRGAATQQRRRLAAKGSE